MENTNLLFGFWTEVCHPCDYSVTWKGNPVVLLKSPIFHNLVSGLLLCRIYPILQIQTVEGAMSTSNKLPWFPENTESKWVLGVGASFTCEGPVSLPGWESKHLNALWRGIKTPIPSLDVGLWQWTSLRTRSQQKDTRRSDARPRQLQKL